MQREIIKLLIREILKNIIILNYKINNLIKNIKIK